MFGLTHLDTVINPSTRYENSQKINTFLNLVKAKQLDTNFASFWANCKVNSSSINTELRVMYNINKIMAMEVEYRIKDNSEMEDFLKNLAELTDMHFYDYDAQFLISSESIIIEVAHDTKKVTLQFANDLKCTIDLNIILSHLLDSDPLLFKKSIILLRHLEATSHMKSYFEFLSKESPLTLHWIGPNIKLSNDVAAYLTNQDQLELHLNRFIFVNSDSVDALAQLLSQNSMEIDLELNDHHMNALVWSYLSSNITWKLLVI